MSQPDSDRLLIDQVQAGDPDAWQQLIERYEGRLRAFVAPRLNERSDAEDVVQETFLGFLTSLPHYDPSRDLTTYLFSIAAHKLTDFLRRQGRRPWDSKTSSDAEGRPLDEIAGRGRTASSIVQSGERHVAEQRTISAALGQLLKQWFERGQFERIKCLELLLVRGMANKDAARLLEITEQAVANYKHQTILQLQKLVRNAGHSDESIIELNS